MHELGVAFYIARDAKKAAEENNVQKVISVTIDLGEVSTVIPYMLEDVWNWTVHKEEGPLHDAKLNIEVTKAVTFCEDCKQEYPTVEHGKICPHCGSEHTYLLRGNELSIRSIEAI